MAKSKSGANVIKPAGQFIAWAVLIIITMLTAYIMISNMQNKPAVLFGRSIVKVVSGSMEPSIHSGDYIIIEKTDCSELKAGDIICFYSHDSAIYGMLNTHRIVRILDDGSFVTKGDANSAEDPSTVTSDTIVGKYTGKVRFLRWLNSFASAKKLILAAVVIVMSATAVYEVITIAKVSAECRANRKNNDDAVREAIEKEKQKLYEQGYEPENTDDKKE